MKEPRSISNGVTALTDDHEGQLAAALARIADETPEERDETVRRDRVRTLAEDAALRDANRRARYLDSRPPKFADASLEDLLQQQDPAGRGRGWLASNAKNALIIGPSGHGKTHLAFAIGNAACDSGLWVEAWAVLELVQALAPLPAHARRDEERSQRQENILEWAKTCDLLILDDLGPEEATGYVAERWRAQLLDILTARDGDPRCRTIVTVNGEPTADQASESAKAQIRARATGQIADRYSARVSTRLQQGCIGIWVEGECLRKVAAWDPFTTNTKEGAS
jgi:DNA replication protein DnaC